VSISIPGRVIVFDYGEVISRSQSEDDKRAILEAGGVDAAGAEAFCLLGAP
jgi:putative hydrolase of the HAD superfamily